MTDESEKDMPRDDRDWVELLRGREAPGADARTLVEAARIRAAMRSAERSQPPAEEGLNRLMFRLKRDGLLDREAKRIRPVHFAIAAALIAALATPIIMQLREKEIPDEYQTRSLGREAVVHSSEPAKTADELASALRGAGASVSVGKEEARSRLDVRVPPGREAAIDAVLARYQIDRGPSRRLLIDVRER